MNIGTSEIILMFAALMVLGLPIAILFITAKLRKDLKKCPFCAETIQSEAIFCRYCRKDLP